MAYDDIKKELNHIANDMFDTYKELVDGLPDGSNPEWDYDDQLVKDFHKAIMEWRKRKEKRSGVG